MAHATHLQKIAAAITAARAIGPRKEVTTMEMVVFAMLLLLLILVVLKQ